MTVPLTPNPIQPYPQERPEPWPARVMGLLGMLLIASLMFTLVVGGPAWALVGLHKLFNPCTERTAP
jgi:hypothetical protein